MCHRRSVGALPPAPNSPVDRPESPPAPPNGWTRLASWSARSDGTALRLLTDDSAATYGGWRIVLERRLSRRVDSTLTTVTLGPGGDSTRNSARSPPAMRVSPCQLRSLRWFRGRPTRGMVLSGPCHRGPGEPASCSLPLIMEAPRLGHRRSPRSPSTRRESATWSRCRQVSTSRRGRSCRPPRRGARR